LTADSVALRGRQRSRTSIYFTGVRGERGGGDTFFCAVFPVVTARVLITPMSDREPDDSSLLRRYVDERSEAAFAELVRRHLDLVYSVALRQTNGDAALAQDVAQSVFTALARKAGELASRRVLGGWLYRTAQFTAIDFVRSESRRRARETEAHVMQLSQNESSTPTDWEKLRPALDRTIGELCDDDRDAVVLRFFEGKSFAEVGARLRLSENTARMRVERALEKMRGQLERHGVTSTAAALGLALANQTGVAAPAGLAASVTGVALAGAGAGAGGLAMIFMGMTKLQIGIVAAVAVAGVTDYAVQANTNARLQAEIAAVQPADAAVAALRAENQQLATVAAEVETMRRDDAMLKQLEQRVTEAKAATVEKARVAQAAASEDVRKRFYDKMRADDQAAQVEVARMNREGNSLVEELKALTEKSHDPARTADERAEADAGVKAKLAAIQSKQQEIQRFTENTRQALAARTENFRRVMGDDSTTPNPTLSTDAGRLEIRRPHSVEQWKSDPVIPAGARLSLGFSQADSQTLISAFERLASTKVILDPSLAAVVGVVDLTTTGATKEEAAQSIRDALRDKFNVVLEPTDDGGMVAKRNSSP
jgi:RNA polymerase sigma factor (sigma-70 family)